MEEIKQELKSYVEVVGLERMNFELKNGDKIQGIKVYYLKQPKIHEDRKEDIKGYKIDIKDCHCFVKDLDRFNELTYNDFPYKAIIKQEFIATDKPLKFIDIEVDNFETL